MFLAALKKEAVPAVIVFFEKSMFRWASYSALPLRNEKRKFRG
jgi:hypothetical protein